ncbi:hemagglutinin repeat-containing protein [Pseudomonas sp. FP597]|uniref:hemagglutinin repeat-containing protein n=1 Tax=Pseudomonas sp. FP597 TaxID=2954096 RepID=UPI002736E537|nr:hemagglutinin repeat-containing protein [Pseudomonas sp. FP597]WLI04087.1 hemagglutinin repeat-containing protein [Pseudomonas sp. FP597]
MDVRQFAFLARQPSAAVKSRSQFLGLPKRGLALILANAMFWQPLLAQAEGIVVSAPGTTLGQAGNGVPIVNIAAPNGSGLSHNQFQDYNVGANGVILNNATGRTQTTQIGGIIVGNPNFNGSAANVILNEVNGASPSQLRGYTEVAGQSAHVIVANPYGITCNGCGFINAPQATLTTGKAVIENGQISRYQVDQGNVAIEGAGLNATNVDQFEIITRAATINAQIQAKKLTIVTGRNDVDARTLNPTARAADGSQAPDLAIDSSALGGMYVGAVKLIGTEAGVGVKLSGDMVAGGDIQIDTAGNVVMGQTSAAAAVNVKAQSVDAKGAVYAGTDLSVKTQGALTNQQTLAAKDSITLDAGGRLTNGGIIEAGINADNSRNAQGDVRLTAQAIDNSGRTVIASRDLNINAGELANQGGTLSAQSNVQLNATRVDNQNQGRVLSAGSLGIQADQLLNSQGGLVTSTGDLTAGVGQLINRNGELSSLAQVTLQLNELDNVAGLISAGRSLSLNTKGLINNQGGRIAARQSARVLAGGLDNRNGEIVATDLVSGTGGLDNRSGKIQGDLSLAITSAALNNQHGTLAAGTALALTATSLDNTEGKLTSDGTLAAAIAGQLFNQTGLFSAKGDARLSLGSLDNRQGTVVADNLNLQLVGPVNNQHGNLRGNVRLDIKAGQLDNSEGGRISSGQSLSASVSSMDQHNDGRLFGQGDVSLDLNGGHLNNQGGLINAPGRLLLSNLNSVDNQGGEISSSQAFTLAANTLDNRNAKLLSERTLTVRIARVLDNIQGLVSAKNLDVEASALDNQSGTLSAGEALTAKVDGALDNRSGRVLTRTGSVKSASLDNRQGLVQGDATLNLNSLGLLDNRQGTLFAVQSADIAAGSLDNSGGKLTSDGQLAALISAHLLNQTGLLSAIGQLQVSAASLDNSSKGNLYSQAAFSLDLNHGHLNNQDGLIHAPGVLLLSNLASVDNMGGEISSAHTLNFTADSLDNRSGKLLSEQGLLVRIARALDNTKGLVAAAGVDLRVNSLTNAEGKLSARDDLTALITTGLDNRQGEILGANTLLTGASLDNSKGLIQADKLVTLNHSGLISNRSGRVAAGQSLDLTAASLDNAGGTLTSDGTLNALISGQLLNQAGLLASAGLLQLTAASLDNQSKGRITGNSELVLTAGQLDNRSGLLNSGKAMTLKVDSLDNRAGEVSSVTELALNGSQLNNSAGGKLLANGDIQLNVDRLDNQLKGRIYAKRNLSMVLKGPLLNQQGILRSDASLTLDMNHGALDNAAGLINTPGVLLLKNLSTVANQKGEISSERGFSLTAESLDNSEGKLLSDQAVTLKIEQALVNIKGVIAAAGLNAQAVRLDNTEGVLTSSKDLSLAVVGEWLNIDGEVSSAGVSVIDAMTLNNRNGQVMSDVSLNLITRGALANQGGTLGAGQRLQINASNVDNSQSGSLVSDGSVTVQVDGLLNNQAKGRVLSKGDMTVKAGSLDNRGGVLNSKQAQALTGQSLNNQGGLISAAGPLLLMWGAADNTKGRIASQAELDATVGVLKQQGGELVAQGNLSLTGNDLDNRNGGLVGGTKALKLNVDRVDNRAGEISGQLKTEISGQRMDNSGGKVLASTALELVMAQVINRTKGLVFAQDLHLSGSSLDNTDGTLAGQRSLAVQLSAGLDNMRGKISSEGSLILRSQRVDNSGGSLSSAGNLTLTSDGELLNVGGVVESAQALNVASASLDNNEQGLLKSQGATIVTTGRFNNDLGGRVVSVGNLDLKTTDLKNGGRIASGGALTANLAGLTQVSGSELFSSSQLNLDMNQGQLTNAGVINAPILVLKNLGSVNNRTGEISSQGAFTLVAKSLDNGNGKLISNQSLDLRIEQALANIKGSISAVGLNARSASLDNTDGLISSRSGLEISADGLIDNQRGSVIGDGNVLMAAAKLDNRAGELAGKAQFTINANRIDNQKGQVVSTETLAMTSANLDNRDGLVGATKALKLDVRDVDNRAGELTSNADLSVTGQRLDNSDGGQVFSATALSLAVNQVLNRARGQLSGQYLSLTGTALDNSGGKLFSQQPLVVDLAGELINSQGLLNSEGMLDVKARSLDNTEGSLSSAQGLSVVVSDNLNNQRGELVTDANLILRSASLGNQQGTVSGKGPVFVTTGALNNQAGRLNSGDTLTLVTAQLNNGGSIGSVKTLSATLTGLDQQAGKLFSQSGLSLDLKNGQLNNRGGLINANGALLLKNLNTIDNLNGEISSDQAFTLSAQSFDNSNGKLLSNQDLTLRVNQALVNIKGLIGSANLNLYAGSVDNQGGTLTGRGELQLTSDGLLNNQSGNLLGGSRATLSAMTLNNTTNGLINSQGTLDITASDLTTGSGGEVSAKGTMDLKLGGLTLSDGQIVGGQDVTLDLNNADLDNRNGLIAAKGALALNRVRAINNQNGELSTQQNLTLNLSSLDNSGGKLISSQVLSVNAATLLNQNGLLSGWQGLSVIGDSLDNRNNGTLSSRNGAVDVRLTGALLNTGAGALVSQGRLGLSAGRLENSAGILSSGAGQRLTVNGQLNNDNGGLIDSGAELDLQALTLGNQAGTINAQKALTITGTDLNNTSGIVAGNDRLTLNLLGSLTNKNGKLASAGPLLLQRAMQVNNQGGQIASQGLLTLLAGSLDNRQQGTIAGKSRVAITSSSALQNDADGLIYSQDADLQIKASILTNAGGSVQGQSGLSLDISGDIDNQGGKLLAQTGDASIKANTLNNQGGGVASLNGLVDVTLNDSLLNGVGYSKGGVVQGQRVNLVALTVDNQQGRIAAQDGDAIITASHFLNAYGGLYANGALQTRGTALDNSFGQIAAKRIDLGLSGQLSNHLGIIEGDETLTLHTNDLVNQGGKLRALARTGKTQFQIGNLFDNRNGIVEIANADLALIATTFQNTGGQLLHAGEGVFDISLPNVTGAGGNIVTRGGLTLNADTWTNSSVIEAGRLNVNVGTFTQTETGKLLASSRLEGKGGHWINNGLIASDGSLALDLTAGYEGIGRVSSVGAMDLTSAQLSLAQLSTIAGGGNTRITVGGALANEGRITSAADLNVTAGVINNYGTLGSTGNLRLSTSALLNQNGLIFSGDDMALRTDTFTNRFADIYGLGNVSIAKDDDNGQSTSINNISATIESGGDLSLAAVNIENRKDAFKATGGLVSSYIGVQCTSCTSIVPNRSSDSYLVWVQNFKSQIVADSASAAMTAGRNFLVTGGDMSNKNSTLSAGGDINFALQNFTNEGASVGDYSLRRSYSYDGLHPYDLSRFMVTVMNYNRDHDPYYNAPAPNIHVWTSDGTESIVRVGHQRNGREDRGSTIYGPLILQNSDKGVDPGVGAADGPWEMLTTQPFNNTTIGSSNAANAVVQAGGAVSINATQTLTNSVVRQNVAVTGNGSRVGATQVAGNTAVMITINRELPPGLALQQVNPLTLPGFSLPSGKNGLFRLSGQAANDSPVSHDNVGSQNWAIGGSNVSVAQRQQTSPGTTGRIIKTADAAQTAAGARQVVLAAREASGINASASTINVAGNVDSGEWQPGRTPGIEINHGDGANTQILRPENFNSLGLTPIERDTAAQITSLTNASRPSLTVPGLSNVARDTSVVANTGAAINIPGLTPQAQEITQLGAAQPINRVKGLPNNSAASQPHKYLIETNPALTEIKQFMSSDYLLAGLGYNPDDSAKRLGDGLYEQRLIQQAVVARTGQRFLDGQTSDDALFRYLMDNAIRSKQSLDLTVGVSLTGEQVAALTHDIVWLEEHEVAGEKVLVPVLYLANADQRLASNGALIAGKDVNLIAGKDLVNAGTLRASNNLSATAGNDLINSGRIEAGNRLDLLAGNNIVNQSGGVIAGRDVTLSATKGDVINERSLTGFGTGNRNYYGDSARIEAANALSITAGRDVTNSGSVLKSGADMAISAGRDINIVSTETRDSGNSGMGARSSSVTQSSSAIDVGANLRMTAGRDVSVVASRIDVKRDLAIAAAGDLSISSAAEEEHSSSHTKKVTRSEDHISQVSSVLTAGGNVSLNAGKDLELTASRITGGGNVALEAQRDLSILSALDEDASFYSKKSKGSFGRSKSEQRESYDSTNVASVVEAGKDLTINASKKADGGMNIEGGRDVTVIGSQLKAGGDMLLGATGDIAVLSGVEEHGSYSKKTKSGFLGLSKSGKSQLKTTATQVGSELEAGNDVVVAAGNDIRLRASEINAENDAELRAGLVKDTGDINLVSANDTAYSRSEKYEEKTGSMSGGFIAISSAKKAGQEAQSSTSVGSQVMADRDATLQAERDINLVGSGISAGRDVSLNAGRDVNVVAAQNSKSERDWAKSKQSGIGVSSDANGVTFFAGTDRSVEKNRLEQQTAAASQISAGENLAITAKRDVNQRGSDLAADNDIDLKAGRNINIDAARERLLVEQQLEKERNGVSASLNHNYGSTKDAVNGAGKGEDNVSKGSSALRGVDAVGQFLAGPTGDLKIGSSSESTSKQVVEVTNRPSTLHAGKDLNITAGNDVAVAGGQLSAGRDINVTGRDIKLDVAKGSIEQNNSQTQSWAGIHGGTSGGAKLGIGGSHGVADEDASHETSTPTVVDAGRDINLVASHDLNLSGTQARSGRDIDLKAGNDLNIGAAKNESNSESKRSSGGGEVGLTFGGEEGAGIYVSVSMGKGDLEREKQGQQNAYLYAGDHLSFNSGRDTNIAGAELRGDQVIGRVGRDLSVSSVPDTGKVKGKEFDISATVTIGPGAGVSGSVGYGQTTGKTNWVEDQTRITGRDKVDIRTEDHTQLDGALIASDTGNLKLDTGTLGFNDIAGKDTEHGYYLNVGGTYKSGQSTTQDPSQVGKGKAGDTGWSASGWKYDKEREQSVRATVGAGEVIVREASDAGSAIAGLNRDVEKAFEVTKDKEKRTDLYISDSSLTAVTNPTAVIGQWKTDANKYGDQTEETIHKLLDLFGAGAQITVGTNPDDVSKEMLGKALFRQLSSRHAEDRAALITKAIGGITGKEQAPENQALIDKLTQIAGDDPNKVLSIISLLKSLNGPETGAKNFVAVPIMAADAVVVTVGAVLVASDATVQEKTRIAANALVAEGAKLGKEGEKQIRTSIALWELLLGTQFPAHQLDPENLVYITPIINVLIEHPSSGGFATGSAVNPAINTGGTQLDGQRDDGKYVTPEHRLDPGNMYSENGSGPKATTNATNTPRFITDSAGNAIDLDYTKGLRETNVTVTGTRGGVQYPLQGQTPDSYANLGNGHVVVYGPEGRALYDVSSSRIKVVEWNQAPNGTYFPKKGSDTKFFEGKVPQSVLDSLGLK